jgi:serine/threonine protein kinase
MSLCINPNCQNPAASLSQNNPFCQDCGSDLLIHGCYRAVRLIGEGGFAKTYEVLEGGIPRVLKVLLPCHSSNQKAVELFQQEAVILSRLNHSGIPKITSNGCFTFLPRGQQNAPLHCFVMEKISGVDLEVWMEDRKGQVILLDLALDWLKQLSQLLNLIHQQQYFHRDIKPSNIMLRPNGQLVLIDFGAAREMTNTYMAKMVRGSVLTSIGSPGYIPPEQANGKGVPQSDFFSLGRTFVYLLTGQSPSNFPESPTTGRMIWHSSAPKIPTLLLEFVDQLMSSFVGNRPKNAQEILQKLQQIEIDIQKTVCVNGKIGAVRQTGKNKLNLKYLLWAIPVTSLTVISYLGFNLFSNRVTKPLQVTESEILPAPISTPVSQPIVVPVQTPVTKSEVKNKAIEIKPSAMPSLSTSEQDSIRFSEKKRRQQDILRQEQEKVAARQRAVDQEREIALQRQYETERQANPPKQEATTNVYENIQVTSNPVTIRPVEPVRDQQVSPSGAAAPWEGTPKKSSVDEISDVIRQTRK